MFSNNFNGFESFFPPEILCVGKKTCWFCLHKKLISIDYIEHCFVFSRSFFGKKTTMNWIYRIEKKIKNIEENKQDTHSCMNGDDASEKKKMPNIKNKLISAAYRFFLAKVVVIIVIHGWYSGSSS